MIGPNLVFLATEIYRMSDDPKFIIRDGDRYYVVYAHHEFTEDTENYDQVHNSFHSGQPVEAVKMVTEAKLAMWVGPET